MADVEYCPHGFCHYYLTVVLLAKQLYFKEILGRLPLGEHASMVQRWLRRMDPSLFEETFGHLVNASMTQDVRAWVQSLDPSFWPSANVSSDIDDIGKVMAHSMVLSGPPLSRLGQALEAFQRGSPIPGFSDRPRINESNL